MAGIYEKFAQVNSKLLNSQFGGPAKLRRTTGGGYDQNGEPVEIETRDLATRAIVKTKEYWNAGAYLGSKLIALLDPAKMPMPQDQLILGSETYTIKTVDVVAPTGVVLRYEVELS